MRKFFFCLFCVAVFVSFNAKNAEADGASLYFSPNSGTFDIGNTFDVSVFINTGNQNANAVKVDLKFDPKKLQLANPSSGKSFISIWVSPPSYSNANGTVSFQGGMPSPGINTSSGLVSTVAFRAIAPGNTKISFLDSSKILLDDGYGTNILNSLGEGNYEISILPPEGPKVFSQTHFDLNKWRKNDNPTFSWEKKDGVTDFSYMIDVDSKGTPDNDSEGNNTSISYSNLDDGIWYFHIKAKKEDVWGGTSHYVILIDKTPPASFSIKIDPSEKTSYKQPIVSFITTDSLSGIDHYEVKTIDITANRENENESFFIETANQYRLPSLEFGKYMVVVRAFDKAGNWRDESTKIEIISEESALANKGVWQNRELFSLWPLLVIFLILIILILITLIILLKRKRKDKREIIRQLKEKREKIQQDLDKIELYDDNQ